MTNRQLNKLIASAGFSAVGLAALFIWHSQLSPMERCLTEECENRVLMEEHAVAIERAERDSERANREAEKTNAALCGNWGICAQ